MNLTNIFNNFIDLLKPVEPATEEETKISLPGIVYVLVSKGGYANYVDAMKNNTHSPIGSKEFISELKAYYAKDYVFLWSNIHASKKTLKDYWDINTREEALETIERLTAGNVHHSYYRACQKAVLNKGIKKNEGNEEILDPKDIEFIKRYTTKNGILAWDLARAYNIINLAEGADFLNKDDVNILRPKVWDQTINSYQNWEEYLNDFMIGRMFWEQTDIPSPVYKEIVEGLKNTNDPYNILNYFPLK